MKKFAFILCALLISNVLCLAQANAPAFGDPKATIFDVASVKGSFKDNIKLVNETDDFEIRFNVSIYLSDSKEWSKCEDVELDSYFDSEEVDCDIDNFAKVCAYIAITPVSGKQYKYATEKSHNDFIITVSDVNPKTVSPSDMTVFEIKEIKGGFLRDRVRFINNSSDANMYFGVYVSKDNVTWEKFGSAYLKENGDTDGVEGPLMLFVYKYKYVGIISGNGKQYTYSPRISSHDLNIKVQD
jgi:hypothetical protein